MTSHHNGTLHERAHNGLNVTPDRHRELDTSATPINNEGGRSLSSSIKDTSPLYANGTKQQQKGSTSSFHEEDLDKEGKSRHKRKHNKSHSSHHRRSKKKENDALNTTMCSDATSTASFAADDGEEEHSESTYRKKEKRHRRQKEGKEDKETVDDDDAAIEEKQQKKQSSGQEKKPSDGEKARENKKKKHNVEGDDEEIHQERSGAAFPNVKQQQEEKGVQGVTTKEEREPKNEKEKISLEAAAEEGAENNDELVAIADPVSGNFVYSPCEEAARRDDSPLVEEGSYYYEGKKLNFRKENKKEEEEEEEENIPSHIPTAFIRLHGPTSHPSSSSVTLPHGGSIVRNSVEKDRDHRPLSSSVSLSPHKKEGDLGHEVVRSSRDHENNHHHHHRVSSNTATAQPHWYISGGRPDEALTVAEREWRAQEEEEEEGEEGAAADCVPPNYIPDGDRTPADNKNKNNNNNNSSQQKERGGGVSGKRTDSFMNTPREFHRQHSRRRSGQEKEGDKMTVRRSVDIYQSPRASSHGGLLRHSRSSISSPLRGSLCASSSDFVEVAFCSKCKHEMAEWVCLTCPIPSMVLCNGCHEEVHGKENIAGGNNNENHVKGEKGTHTRTAVFMVPQQQEQVIKRYLRHRVKSVTSLDDVRKIEAARIADEGYFPFRLRQEEEELEEKRGKGVKGTHSSGKKEKMAEEESPTQNNNNNSPDTTKVEKEKKETQNSHHPAHEEDVPVRAAPMHPTTSGSQPSEQVNTTNNNDLLSENTALLNSEENNNTNSNTYGHLSKKARKALLSAPNVDSSRFTRPMHSLKRSDVSKPWSPGHPLIVAFVTYNMGQNHPSPSELEQLFRFETAENNDNEEIEQEGEEEERRTERVMVENDEGRAPQQQQQREPERQAAANVVENSSCCPMPHVITLTTQENGPYIGTNEQHKEWLRMTNKALNDCARRQHGEDLARRRGGGGQAEVSHPDNNRGNNPNELSPSDLYTIISAKSLWAQHMTVWVRRADILHQVRYANTSWVKTGGKSRRFGNKGAVALSFIIGNDDAMIGNDDAMVMGEDGRNAISGEVRRDTDTTPAASPTEAIPQQPKESVADASDQRNERGPQPAASSSIDYSPREDKDENISNEKKEKEEKLKAVDTSEEKCKKQDVGEASSTPVAATVTDSEVPLQQQATVTTVNRPHLASQASSSSSLRRTGGLSLLIVGAHLTPHDYNVQRRHDDYKAIIEQMQLGKKGLYAEHSRNGDVVSSSSGQQEQRDVTDEFDIVLFGGDLNYRLQGTRNATIAMLEEASDRSLANSTRSYFAPEVLIANDQLTQARSRGIIFKGFNEAPILFPPTYKYATGTDRYDITKRLPAYTDRVLYKKHPRCPMNVHPIEYCDIGTMRASDHRPLRSVFSLVQPMSPSSSSSSFPVLNAPPSSSGTDVEPQRYCALDTESPWCCC